MEPQPPNRWLAWLTHRLPLAVVTLTFSWVLYTHLYLSQHAPLRLRNAGQFVLKDAWTGHGFYEGWNWETFNDPTHGRVNYVSKDTALALNLTYATDSSFIMRASTSGVLSPWARGRDSVRISTKAAYGDSLVILDLKHMPTGCGTWPAFWSTSRRGPWPTGGEIDIVEGVHRETNNLMSLHTLPGCEMRPRRLQSGTPTANQCDARLNFNQGCGVQSTSARSFGAPFNAVGGGWYAMRRTQRDGIAIWFWSRDDPRVPPEVAGLPPNASAPIAGGLVVVGALLAGREVISPSAHWGTPQAVFPPESCAPVRYFDEHVLVFDQTFCGEFAGEPNVWAKSGCKTPTYSSCNTFVETAPQAFEQAYWDVKGVRVYIPIA